MSELATIVSKSAPLLGAALNTVLPGSSLLISGLSALFGLKGNDTDLLATTIASDPNAAEKLREFEIAHRYDLESILAADRASAREMNTQTTKATGKTDYMLHMLAFCVIGQLMAYILLGYFIPAHFDKGVMHDLINLAMMPLSFYYGGMYVQARQSRVELPPPAQTR